MLNMNQLRVFCEAARSGNFTGAAKRLCITQPAVTAQVRSFEELCGLKLFKKRGRKVYLTDEGKTLYEYARRVFEFEKDVEQSIEDMRKLKRGILRIATSKTYARYFMPSFITGFRKAYPGIKICLDEGSSTTMVQSLVEMKNELAVIAKVGEHPEVCFIPFSREDLVLIMPPAHRLTRRRQVRPEDLADEPIIMKEVGSGTRRLVNLFFERNGIPANILVETSNTEFIKQLVQRGDGISFLVQEAVEVDIREGKLATRPLKGEQLLLDVSIAHLRDQHLSPPGKAFLEVLLKLTPQASVHPLA
jgi:DNA-binding transcriptional LysR family regulator